MPSRRLVVKAVGAGVVGTAGLGYWQRKRILRHDDVESMDAALEIDVPTFDYGAAVSDDHLESAYERMSDVREKAETELGDAQMDERWADRHQLSETTQQDLDDAPETDRRDALSEYRGETGRLYSSIGDARYEEGSTNERSTDEEDVLDRVDAERAALESLEYDYLGETITDAIVSGAVADDRYRAAENNLGRAEDQDFTTDHAYRNAWDQLGRARGDRHDAEQFARSLEGEDYTDRLETAVETVSETIEERQDEIDWEHDEAEVNYASSVASSPSMRLSDSRPYPHESLADEGSLASALVDASTRYTTVVSLEAITDIPAQHYWNEIDWTADPDSLPERKRDAVDAVERVLDADGDDPLARLLLTDAVDSLEGADNSLASSLENANDADERAWTRQLNGAYADYRAATAFAERVPDTIALLIDGE